MFVQSLLLWNSHSTRYSIYLMVYKWLYFWCYICWRKHLHVWLYQLLEQSTIAFLHLHIVKSNGVVVYNGLFLVLFYLDPILFYYPMGTEQQVPLLSTTICFWFHGLYVTHTDSGNIINIYVILFEWVGRHFEPTHSPSNSMQIISELKILLCFEKITRISFN